MQQFQSNKLLTGIYLSAAMDRKVEMQAIAVELCEKFDACITSRWIYDTPIGNTPAECAQGDLTDIRRAQIFILFEDGRERATRGMQVELGYALALKREFRWPHTIIIAGETKSAFHQLSDFVHAPSGLPGVFEFLETFQSLKRQHSANAPRP